MDRRRSRRKRHPFRSPIEPGIVSVNPKVVMGIVPVIIFASSVVGGFYLQRERLQQAQIELATVKADVETLKLERAAQADDHSLLLQIRQDTQRIKVRLRIE